LIRFHAIVLLSVAVSIKIDGWIQRLGHQADRRMVIG
jgi:hypothetical protein